MPDTAGQSPYDQVLESFVERLTDVCRRFDEETDIFYLIEEFTVKKEATGKFVLNITTNQPIEPVGFWNEDQLQDTDDEQH